ncbi:MAG: hypothetical protein IT427_07950, partial [Pirellulales bacterium]|nr:hypothetical protein [Pirellulales bacterium]
MVENFLQVLRDHTAGDPLRADVKWTNLSRRQISRRLGERGTPAGRRVVSRLLREHGYRRRQAQKKKTMGRHVEPEVVKFFIADAPQETPLTELLHVAFSRWRVERSFEDQKTE